MTPVDARQNDPELLERMCEQLRTLVEVESPSHDLQAVARGADAVAEFGEHLLGCRPKQIVVDGRTHVRWDLGGAPRVLLLGHQDTVWPLGSLERHPWTLSGGRASGPGCFDMKAGLVQLFHAVAALDDREGIRILVTGDEELGAPSSRELIAHDAAECGVTLVLEASADGGALKVARRGVSRYELRVEGRAAHAGLEPWAGVNAGVEIARQLLEIASWDAGPDGATVTPTLLSAGTASNAVPAEATLAVDVRTTTVEDAKRIDRMVHALAPSLEGATLQVRGGITHPTLEPRSTGALFQLAQDTARLVGITELRGVAVGGASDGNFAAAAGSQVLDGLGAVGGGAHAADEHVVVEEMPRRAALLAGLLARVLDGTGEGL